MIRHLRVLSKFYYIVGAMTSRSSGTISAPIPLRTAVGLLTSMMRNPEQEKICCVRMSLAADRIDQALEECPNLSEKIKLVKSFPELLRTGIKFLTTNQSPQAHISMMKEHFATCSCNLGDPAVRKLHLPSPTRRRNWESHAQIDPLAMLYDPVNTLCNCIVLALSDLSKHKFRNPNTNGVPNWPQDANDLLPSGTQGAIKGLSLWSQVFPFGYSIFTLTGSLALFYSPFSNEIFLERNRVMTLAVPVNHLRKTVDFYDESIGGRIPYDLSAPRNISYFEKPLKAIFGFFDDIKRDTMFEFCTMMTVHGHWISNVLERLQTILPTIPAEWSSKLLAQVKLIIPFSIARSNPVLGTILAKEQYAVPSVNTPEKAFEYIIGVRKLGCLHTTCTGSHEVVQLRVCAKCDLMRFCGKNVCSDVLLLLSLFWLTSDLSFHSSARRKHGKRLSYRIRRFVAKLLP